MKANQIEILSCSYGKKVTMGYHNKVDSNHYDVEDENNTPHPDLKKAVQALHVEFAAAHYVLGAERDKFVSTGFSITKAGGEETIDQVNISGKIVNAHDDTVSTKSGDIPITEGKLEEKITSLRAELWQFFFNEKFAVSQGTLSAFPTKKEAANGEPAASEVQKGDGE